MTSNLMFADQAMDLHDPLAALLIENSSVDSQLVLARLEAELPGAQVTTCVTLQQAREHLTQGAYDVVVTDLVLPDGEGMEVVQEVLAHLGGAALVVLTGTDDSRLALAALSGGAQDYLVKGRDGGPRLAIAILHAVQRKRAEQASRSSLQFAQGVLDALESATCAVDAGGRLVAVNEAWRAFAVAGGGTYERCGVGANYFDGCASDVESDPGAAQGREVAAALREVLAGRCKRFRMEYACHSPTDQQWFSVRISPTLINGEPGAVIMHVEVTDMRHAQEALSHQALHDALTNLPNRTLLLDRLDKALEDGARRGSGAAVAFIDLDHFKRVNDSLGHPAGDLLLAQVASRLSQAVRPGDTVARFSGDEFVVVWRDLHSVHEAELLSARLMQTLSVPFQLNGTPVTVSASIGVSVGCLPQTPDELLLAADAVMYDAKAHGRGRVRVFSSDLREGVEQRMATEVGLRQALARDELVLHYQPVVDLTSGRAVGVEALVRWQHPRDGLIGPDRFIPVAEASGLIVPLGRWVLQRACRDAASWSGPLAGLDVAVNLSVRQLTQPDVLRHVRDALATSGLAPERLLLEVTESAVMEDAEAAGLALEGLASLGVRIAIDDFGTGYSSLLYLRRYPISVLKLDRAFVSGIGVSADDDAICSSVVSLAHAVSATSIAEGVETLEQYAALRALGCQLAQGFLWSPAVPLDQLAAAVTGLAGITVPRSASRSRIAVQRADVRVSARIQQLHGAGASLHTIAAALNREGAVNPAGVRWHAHAVARVVAAEGPASARRPTG